MNCLCEGKYFLVTVVTNTEMYPKARLRGRNRVQNLFSEERSVHRLPVESDKQIQGGQGKSSKNTRNKGGQMTGHMQVKNIGARKTIRLGENNSRGNLKQRD